MKRDTIPLYEGQLMANRVGRIVRAGIEFDIIRPGYDTQGRRRTTWTQFCVEGVSVYEYRKQARLDKAIRQFDKLWAKRIGTNDDLARAAVAAARKERQGKFRNGTSGESPAPALRIDGRPDPTVYES